MHDFLRKKTIFTKFEKKTSLKLCKFRGNEVLISNKKGNGIEIKKFKILFINPGPSIRYRPIPGPIGSGQIQPSDEIRSESGLRNPMKSLVSDFFVGFRWISSDYDGFRWVPYWIRSDPLSDSWTWVVLRVTYRFGRSLRNVLVLKETMQGFMRKLRKLQIIYETINHFVYNILNLQIVYEITRRFM